MNNCTVFTCEGIKACGPYYSIAQKYYCDTTVHHLTYSYHIIIPIIVILSITTLSLVVSHFLYPNLITLFQGKVNENIISNVLVPAINSLPDIINYHYGMNNPSMVIGQVIGSNLMILGLTLGLIGILISDNHLVSDIEHQIENCEQPEEDYHRERTRLIKNNTSVETLEISTVETPDGSDLKSSVLWLVTVVLIFIYIIYDGKITTAESIFMIFTYLAYLSHLVYSPQPPIVDIDEELEHDPDSIIHYFIHAVVFILQLIISSSVYYLTFSILLYFKIPSLYTIVGIVILSPSIIYPITKQIIGVVNSVLVISYILSLVVKVIVNYGTILQITGYALGYLIFSIANSLNDTVTNVTLSLINRKLGMNACLGTPVLLILLGLGLNCLHGVEFDGFKVGAGGLVGMIVMILMSWLTGWKRSLGWVSVGYWLIMEIVNIVNS